jgi:hypothetical protein
MKLLEFESNRADDRCNVNDPRFSESVFINPECVQHVCSMTQNIGRPFDNQTIIYFKGGQVMNVKASHTLVAAAINRALESEANETS